MKTENGEARGCGTCKYAAASLLEDPCYKCLKNTFRFKGEAYPEWEPQEKKT